MPQHNAMPSLVDPKPDDTSLNDFMLGGDSDEVEQGTTAKLPAKTKARSKPKAKPKDKVSLQRSIYFTEAEVAYIDSQRGVAKMSTYLRQALHDAGFFKGMKR